MVRLGIGPSITFSDDIDRLMGRFVLRDPETATLLARVAPSGFQFGQLSGFQQDYHLEGIIKKVIFRDAFEPAGIQWGSTVGTAAINAALQSMFSNNTLSLVTGPLAGNDANALKRLPGFPVSKLKLVAYWALRAAANTTPRLFEFQITHVAGAVVRRLNLRYAHHSGGAFDNEWQYEAAGPVWTTIAGSAEVINASNTESLWQRLEVDVDFTGTNARITALKTNLLDLTGLTLDCFIPAHAVQHSVTPLFLVETDAAAATTGAISYVGIFEID